MIEQKSISEKYKFLGQYMTPQSLCEELISGIDLLDSTIVEPSFGTGNFVKALSNKGYIDNVYGFDIDSLMFEKKEFGSNFKNINFYDVDFKSDNKIIFIGNPPFRTPALSLTTHKSIIKNLCKKFKLKGIREEAVFFILKTIDIIETNGKGGEIHYILPKNIMTNNSKFFIRFQEIIKEKFDLLSMIDISADYFENVNLDMVFISLRYNNKIINHAKEIKDYYDFNDIFKRTYLGSVPCESIFLSVKNEPIGNFKTRLIKLYNCEKEDLFESLKYKENTHLKVLNSGNEELINKKLSVIWDYLTEIKDKYGDEFIEELNNDDNYKEINHRHEIRFYFRCPKLKKLSFVYEINPNPCKSFYFTGNPSKKSTDYFGYCEYDITRNSSPGACRTIPIDGLENNLNDEFKEWWDTNIKQPYEKIFELFFLVSKSNWYKEMKNKYNRFYFSIPKSTRYDNGFTL